MTRRRTNEEVYGGAAEYMNQTALIIKQLTEQATKIEELQAQMKRLREENSKREQEFHSKEDRQDKTITALEQKIDGLNKEINKNTLQIQTLGLKTERQQQQIERQQKEIESLRTSSQKKEEELKTNVSTTSVAESLQARLSSSSHQKKSGLFSANSSCQSHDQEATTSTIAASNSHLTKFQNPKIPGLPTTMSSPSAASSVKTMPTSFATSKKVLFSNPIGEPQKIVRGPLCLPMLPTKKIAGLHSIATLNNPKKLFLVLNSESFYDQFLVTISPISQFKVTLMDTNETGKYRIIRFSIPRKDEEGNVYEILKCVFDFEGIPVQKFDTYPDLQKAYSGIIFQSLIKSNNYS